MMLLCDMCEWIVCNGVLRFFFFQAEDGIRDLVRSRGLGDVYKRQPHQRHERHQRHRREGTHRRPGARRREHGGCRIHGCLLYTSDAADERSSVDLGGRRIIKKKTRLCTCHQIPQLANSDQLNNYISTIITLIIKNG